MRLCRKITLLALLCGTLSACATETMRNILPTDMIGKKNAIVVGRVISDKSNIGILVHENDHSNPSAYIWIEPAHRKGERFERVFAMEVDAGYVKYTNVKSGAMYAHMFDEKDPYTFAPPGQITYIGDLAVNMGSFVRVSFRLTDNRAATISDVKKDMPWLFDKYPMNDKDIKKLHSEINK